MCRSGSVANIPRAVERYHISTCHPDRNEMEWRDLPKLQALPYAGYFCNLGGFLHSAFAKGLNDIRFNVSTDSPTVSTAFHAAPRPSSGSPRRTSSPQGKLLYRAFGCRILPEHSAKRRNVRPFKNCQLPIVNCQLGKTVHCQLLTSRSRKAAAPISRCGDFYSTCTLSGSNTRWQESPTW